MTVAVVGTFVRSDISPKTSEPPRPLKARPFFETFTLPSATTKNCRPRSPSRIIVLPAGMSISSAIIAISASWLFVQPENSGTRFRSSIFAFLRSMPMALLVRGGSDRECVV